MSVLCVVCTELMVKMCPDNDCLTNYLHLLDRCSCHLVTKSSSLPFPPCLTLSNLFLVVIGSIFLQLLLCSSACVKCYDKAASATVDSYHIYFM